MSKKSELIRSFLKGYNQETRFDMYDLVLSEKSEEWLIRRLKECVITFERCPTIAEIMQTNRLETAETEQAWDKFKDTCCNNNRKIPMEDWVFTIKKAIGNEDVEEMNGNSEKWIKKEFLRIYPAVKAGLMKLQSEPYTYLKEGSSWIAIAKTENTLEIGDGYE